MGTAPDRGGHRARDCVGQPVCLPCIPRIRLRARDRRRAQSRPWSTGRVVGDDVPHKGRCVQWPPRASSHGDKGLCPRRSRRPTDRPIVYLDQPRSRADVDAIAPGTRSWRRGGDPSCRRPSTGDRGVERPGRHLRPVDRRRRSNLASRRACRGWDASLRRLAWDNRASRRQRQGGGPLDRDAAVNGAMDAGCRHDDRSFDRASPVGSRTRRHRPERSARYRL